MTYRELIQVLISNVPERQLDDEVYFCVLDCNSVSVDVWVVDEDMVNPDGDGWEPKSNFQSSDPDGDDYIEPDEPIVAHKDDVFLVDGRYC